MFEEKVPQSSVNLKLLLPAVAVLALAVLGALLYLSPEPPPRADQELPGILRRGNPEFDEYLEFLKLGDTKVSLALSFSGNRSVIFSGRVHNLGRRSLDAVEVKLTLFNYDEAVWDTTRTVYRPGPRKEPIRPFQQRRLSLYLEDLPKEWESSHAEIEIHGFRFEGWQGE
ncbi:MAG: hypothetical protein V3T83_14210 [Acidobacteriota bacterium]